MKYEWKDLEGKPFFDREKYWVSPFNFQTEEYRPFQGLSVEIHDCTLRDGEQTLGVSYSLDERVRIAEELSELGVSRIEAGMPIVSESIVKALKLLMRKNLPSKIFSFARAHEKDLQLTVDAGVRHVVIEHNVNPYICRNAYELDAGAVQERVAKAVRFAKEQGLFVTFMGWDLTRGDDMDFLYGIYRAAVVDGGADGITIVDTYGVAAPYACRLLVKKFRDWFPQTLIEFHSHNDFGWGVAGAVEAVAAGAGCIHTAVNGIGERTGNVATEQVAIALELGLKVSTGISLDRIKKASRLVSDITGMRVESNRPVVGDAIFKLETGVAAHILTKLPKGLNVGSVPFHSSVVGAPPLEVVSGSGSGRASVEFMLDAHQISLPSDQIDEVVERVKNESRIRRRILTQEELKDICAAVKGN